MGAGSSRDKMRVGRKQCQYVDEKSVGDGAGIDQPSRFA
jgi:hypothetical protein